MAAQFMPLKDLRSEAEKRLALNKVNRGVNDLSLVGLIHELEVHQVELALQNELLAESCAEAEALSARYKELYDFAPIGYLTLSRSGEILEVNRRGAQMLGQKAGKLSGLQLRTFFGRDSIAGFDAFISAVLGSTEEVASKYLLLRRKPLPVSVKVQGRAFTDKESGNVSIWLAMMDVSAQKAAMEDAIKALKTNSGFSPL